MTVVTVTTASKLTAAQKKEVEQVLKKKLSSFKMREVVDEAVLGGIQLRIGESVLDATVAGTLERLPSERSEAIVTTAVPITTQQREKIQTLVANKDATLTLKEVVDPHVIGGIKLQIGSTLYDQTIRHQLSELQKSMIAQM
ncbi:MAG: F0F1 ATP synthase subunit delta [Pseudomonadales bacterium]|nr:F0F1 ATP synthase subunit delta [Pseudomonadales bacterium]